MAILSPILDEIVASLFVVGSPAVGYIVLRAAIRSSGAWKGWKRLGMSIFIGGGGVGMLVKTFLPYTSQKIVPQTIGEFFVFSGMGIILLTAMVGLVNRVVWHGLVMRWHPLAHFHMTPSPARVKENRPALPPQQRIPSTPLPFQRPTKLVQAKTPAQAYAPFEDLPEEPASMETPSSGSDALDLLQAEARESGERSTVTGAATPGGRKAPMSQLGEFAGFEDTIEQLKRDLKDFNESVETHTHNKPRKRPPA